VNTLVDTSVWSLAFRRKTTDLNPVETAIVTELHELVREGRARIVGLIRQELLSGIRTPAQYEKLGDLLRDFTDERVHTVDHEEAARLGNRCRLKGIAVNVVDMLVCSIAIGREWTIFSSDPDFHYYGKVLPIKLHEPRK
jgi:predicted nucleic acid-binding protein